MQGAQEMEAVRQDAESSKAREKETYMKCQYLESRLAEMERKLDALLGKQSESLPTEAGIENTNDIQNIDTATQGKMNMLNGVLYAKLFNLFGSIGRINM